MSVLGGRKEHNSVRVHSTFSHVCGTDELLCVVWIDCTFEAKAHVGLNNYRTILSTVELHIVHSLYAVSKG